MKRSKIGLLVVGILIFNSLFVAIQEVAAFPGYNGKIVSGVVDAGWTIDGTADIYTLNVDGTGYAPLLATAWSESRPRWSADGKEIVYVTNSDGNSEIYRMKADGSDRVRLTHNSDNDDNPHFSPDGQNVVFRSNRDGNNEIYIMDRDGGNAQRLTNNNANDTTPSFSPDGARIVFTSDRDGNHDIYVMNADGTGVEQLTFTDLLISGPRFSPDGQKIVYYATSFGAGANNRIWLIDSDGNNPTQLTTDPPAGSTSHHYPTWSPDGSQILFTAHMDTTNPTLGRGYFLIPLLGGAIRQIAGLSAGSTSITDWQPIPNKAPILSSKTLSVVSGASKTVDMMLGSTDEEDLSVANLTIIAPPSRGSAVIDSGKIEYRASDNYVGPDAVQYQVCDSFVLDQKCSTKTLVVAVTPKLGLSKVGGMEADGSRKIVSPTDKPTFSGYTTPLAQVKVEIHSEPIILTAQANEEGYWSVAPTSSLPPGDHTVYISSTFNGQTTQLDSFVLGIQAITPNTGADYVLWRAGGIGLVGLGLIGFNLVFRQRKCGVPELFPR